MTETGDDQISLDLTADPGGALLSALAALVWPLQAALLAAALAALLGPGPGIHPLWAAAGYFGLAALRALIDRAAQRRLSEAAEAILTRLRHEIVATETTAAAPSAIGNAGALAALATEKIEALRPYLTRYRPARMRVAVVPPVILALALWQGWAVAVVLLAAGPLIPVFMALVGWAAKEASARQMVEVGRLSDLLADRLAALADLSLAGAGGTVAEGFARASDDLRARTMTVLRIAFLSSGVLEFFAALGVAMVAVWVGFALLGAIGWGTWGPPLSPGAGIFLLLIAPEYFRPLRDLAAAWHDKAAAEAVLDEIAAWRDDARPQVLGTGRCPDVPAPATRTAPALATVALSGVMVRRGARRIVYPDLSIPPGSSLAVTGPSGSGKTTLLRLLAGLDRPDAGAVLIDGRALDETTADAWRAGLGWMPQTPRFLNRSLRHNIGFGAPVGSGLIAQARLGGVVAALPRGLDTCLGERGAGLSGGEARRATLARALHGPPGVLLADEPTADLDAATAAEVTAGLLDFAAAGGTLIVATHDPRLGAVADRTLALDPEAAT